MKRGKIILWILIFSIIISCLSACNNLSTGENDNIKDTNKEENVGSTPVAESETEAVNPLDDILDEDFKNYEFKFLNIPPDNWAITPIFVEEETGDTVLDAMYRRNKKIEEKFNIKIIEINNANPAAAFKKGVSANDQSYDAAYMRAYDCTPLSSQGLLYNLFDMPNIDLGNPWWDQSCVNQVSLYNKMYFVTGDISLHATDATWVIFFNKSMIADLGLDNPYELVLNNKWTLDKFNEFIVAASKDLNGDGIVDPSDRFGIMSHTATYNPFIFACNERFVGKDSNDAPIYAMTSESFATKYMKVVDILNNKTTTGMWSRDKYWDNDWMNVFFEGRSLFMAQTLGLLSLGEMRNMQENFGLLPLPKYDEAQQNYISTVLDTALVLSVPVNAENLERTGIILEAMGAESYNSVIPAYYDIALQYKLTRDEESVKMLDIIRQNRIYEISWFYRFGDVGTSITSMVNKGDTNIVSYVEKSRDKVEKAFEKFEEAYANQ